MHDCAARRRGVTPTGKNRVPQPALRTLLGERGFESPQSWIQSGNFVLGSDLDEAAVAARVQEVIRELNGAEIDVIVREPAVFAADVLANPFTDAEDSKHYFTWLRAEPDPATIDTLRAKDFGRDRWQIRGRMLYLTYFTGASDSRLTNSTIERALKVRATSRNYNTSTKLIEICRERGSLPRA